jgi:hypothetical protein
MYLYGNPDKAALAKCELELNKKRHSLGSVRTLVLVRIATEFVQSASFAGEHETVRTRLEIRLSFARVTSPVVVAVLLVFEKAAVRLVTTTTKVGRLRRT